MLSRRRFLQGSIAFCGTALLPTMSFAQDADTQTLYDCIIIGAGPAGLTAARNLALYPFRGRRLKILVLEGNSRIGGRIFTNHSKAADFGSPLEMGAEYIHLPDGAAPIWEEVRRYRLQIKTYPKIFRGHLYNSEYLAPIPRSPLYLVGHLNFHVLKASRIFKDILNYEGPDISAAQFIKLQRYDDFVSQCAEAILAGHLGVSPHRVSLLGFKADHLAEQLKLANEYFVLGGYDSILRGMVREISPRRLLLNHPVHKIRPGKHKTILAQVPGVGWFQAKSLLCTASVGMLQSHAIDFGDFWTSEKEHALQYVKASRGIKMSIRFKEKFWSNSMCMLNHLEESLRKAGKTYFIPHYREDEKPPVLTTLIGGDDARELHHLSPRELLYRVCQDLGEMFKLPEPVIKKVSRRSDGSPIYSYKNWADDPFAKGAISALHINEDFRKMRVTDARAALASSKNTQPLFWAGEATSLTQQPSSVHGAHASGLRAAREIYNYLARSE